MAGCLCTNWRYIFRQKGICPLKNSIKIAHILPFACLVVFLPSQRNDTPSFSSGTEASGDIMSCWYPALSQCQLLICPPPWNILRTLGQKEAKPLLPNMIFWIQISWHIHLFPSNSLHYLWQTFLKHLQAENHGSSQCPVIVPVIQKTVHHYGLIENIHTIKV